MNRWEKPSFYRWFNKFSKGSKQLEDESRSGAPKSARKEKNIQKVQKLMMQDRQMSVRMLFEAGGVDIGIVNTILTEILNSTKFVPSFYQRRELSNGRAINGDSARIMPHVTSKHWSSPEWPIGERKPYNTHPTAITYPPVTFLCSHAWKKALKEPDITKLRSWKSHRKIVWWDH